MENKFKIIIFLLFSICLSKDGAIGQTYFKNNVESEKYFNQKITHFSNGDLLIGDSSLESLRNGTNGKIFLNRLDVCGNKVWSLGYNLPEGYLEFKDFKINESDEIFAYGSFYRGLEELIFLMKVNGDTGENLDFRLFLPGTVDHFSFSMDLKNGALMIYGLLLNFNTQKEGFIAIFNERLNFQRATKFAPFESFGDAIFDRNNDFIARSGSFLIKLTTNGALEWAFALNATVPIQIISGPVEVADGFVFEGHQNETSFLFKIDETGQLIWKSNQFPASKYGATISPLGMGDLLCTYNAPDGSYTQLCQLQISRDGDITNQRKLIIGQNLNTGTLHQIINQDNIITIAGNADLFSTAPVDVKDFLLQFSLDTLSEDCFFWEDFSGTTPNQFDFDLSAYDFVPEPFDMVLEQSIDLDTLNYSPILTEVCDNGTRLDFLQKDTFLPCDEDWLIALPAADFVWLDETEDNPRLIDMPGTYKAKKLSCVDPIIIEYTLEKENCGCSVYLPNAFSPNQDGVNDQFQLFSDCVLVIAEMMIYDRWGERLFFSRNPNDFWDGKYQDKEMSSGVYLVSVKYEWVDFDGTVQSGSLFKSITLVR